MEPQTYVVLIGAVSRAVSLAIAGVGGIFCIFLGWLLYRDGVKVATAGLIDHKDFKFKLTTSGPGVFLVAFGAGILVYLVGHQATFNMPEPECPETGQIGKSSLNVLRQYQLQNAVTKAIPSENILITRVSTASPKPAAATPKAAECKPCRVWAATFLDGAPMSNQYKAALDKSIALLSVARQEALQQKDEKQVEELRDHIDRLRELKGNLNEK